jgi:DNA repair exonuclease SbcCD ATPase subunit
MADDRQSSSPADQVARLYEQAESQAAQASERLVGSGGFASLLGQLAENAAALTKLSNDAMDLLMRNLRVAGRRDVVRLSRQLARTEDKLERVLQELEELRDQLGDREEQTPSASSARASRRAPSDDTPGNGAPAAGSSAQRSARSGGPNRGAGAESGQPPGS